MRRDTLPIIVGGCHRSGTSLVRRILNAHSRIFCGPEVKFFRDFYQEYAQDPLSHLRFINSARTILPEPEVLQILGKAYISILERAAARAGKVRWADKCPENVLHLGDWQTLLGERWLFVHVVRNPLDTIASMSEARFHLTLPEDLAGKVAHYRAFTEQGLSFAATNSDRSYRVVYEALVLSPEAELASLMAWLGEDMERAQLEFNKVAHQPGLEDPKVASTTTVHALSVGRWRNVLSPGEAYEVWRQTADIWRRIDPNNDFGRTCGLSEPEFAC